MLEEFPGSTINDSSLGLLSFQCSWTMDGTWKAWITLFLGIHQVWSPSLEITFCNHGISTTRRNFVLPRNLWLQVLNDYMYDFGHKLLLWIMCVKNHSHILMGHVTSRWWGGNKMGDVSYHFYFIYIASMIGDKVEWMSNYYND